MERYSALKQKARATKRKFSNIEKKLRSPLDEITLDDADQNMKDILQRAMLYVTENETSCQKAILKALLDLEQKRAVASKAGSPDVDDDPESTNEELADFILNEMKNNAKVIAGKGCTIRYSARTVRIAMSIWLRSPAAYREFKEASLTIFPSERYLRSMKTMTVYEEGDDPRIYGWYHDEIVSKKKGEKMIGQLLYDELKLKSDFAFHSGTNKTVGMVSRNSDSMSLIDELDVLVDDRSTEFEAFEPALYVNQYRFRGVFGERHNANYFYNKGSLTGDAILRQMIHVISCYDMINVEIHGICSDAGGGNARLFTLLTRGSKVASGNDSQK
jgi:hypothetical protein